MTKNDTNENATLDEIARLHHKNAEKRIEILKGGNAPARDIGNSADLVLTVLHTAHVFANDVFNAKHTHEDVFAIYDRLINELNSKRYHDYEDE